MKTINKTILKQKLIMVSSRLNHLIRFYKAAIEALHYFQSLGTMAKP